MPDPYLHGHHESVLRSHRWRTAANSAAYLVPHLRPGMDLLDVGCGPGTITVDLARLVAPGRVVGTDVAAGVLVKAGELAAARGAPTVVFEQADVYELPYRDGSFDVVHAHQVLQHLSDPVAALREMRRVARPGGLVAVRDADYGSLSWYPGSEGLSRWAELYEEVTLRSSGTPRAGRRLVAWAREAGLDDVTASASAWCFAGEQERSWWGELWAERVTTSSFAHRAVSAGLADVEALAGIATSWREWAADEDGWFAVLHGEVLARR
jgi:ubiquinone/menaquinone biosynthesis C-methylase UbiE